MEGKTARGASSPANPAFTRPEPLSHTRAVVSSSSHMVSAQLCNTHEDVRAHARLDPVIQSTKQCLVDCIDRLY